MYSIQWFNSNVNENGKTENIFVGTARKRKGKKKKTEMKRTQHFKNAIDGVAFAHIRIAHNFSQLSRTDKKK